MGSTQRFGLTTLTEGTTLSSKGGKFGVSDRRVLDRVLTALETHDHTGGERLGDPTGAPALSQLDVGGLLPGGQTYYYRVAYIDRFGLESAPGPEAVISTPGNLTAPTSPALAASVGGTLAAGNYFYALTLEKDGYSTQLGSSAIITVPAGSQVTLTLPAPPVGAVYGVWRQGPTDSYFSRIGSSPGPTAVDDGSVPPSDCPTDPANLPPMTNRTNSTNVVIVEVPDPALVGAVDSEVKGWRIYRTRSSGQYEGNSLVAEVSTLDPNTGALPTTFQDTGAALLNGVPKDVSQTLTPSTLIESGGGGGGGGTSTVLLDSGSGVWRVIAAEDGAILTRVSDLASYGVQIALTSPDATIWLLGVTTDGAVTTTAGTPAADAIVFGAGEGPVLPTANPTGDFQLTVEDDGALVTTLLGEPMPMVTSGGGTGGGASETEFVVFSHDLIAGQDGVPTDYPIERWGYGAAYGLPVGGNSMIQATVEFPSDWPAFTVQAIGIGYGSGDLSLGGVEAFWWNNPGSPIPFVYGTPSPVIVHSLSYVDEYFDYLDALTTPIAVDGSRAGVVVKSPADTYNDIYYIFGLRFMRAEL